MSRDGLLDAPIDASSSSTFLSRVVAVVSPSRRGRNRRVDAEETQRLGVERSSDGSSLARAYGAHDDHSSDASDVEAFVDALESASDSERVDGSSGPRARWASAPGRGLRLASAVALSVVVVCALLFRLLGNDSGNLGNGDAASSETMTWTRRDAGASPASPGGWRLPEGRKRGKQWHASKYSSESGFKKLSSSLSVLGTLSFGRRKSARMGSLEDRLAKTWDPTKIKLHAGGRLPDTFDVREKWPKCAALVSEAVDQGACGSCWAVAPAKAMTDRLCIATNGAVNTHVSAIQLLSCNSHSNSAYTYDENLAGGSGGCMGGYPTEAYETAHRVGVVSGGLNGDQDTCMPYPFAPCHHPCEPNHNAVCPRTCQRSATQTANTTRYAVGHLVQCGLNDYDCMASEIFERGPVTTFVGDVYDEFYQYERGVYKLSKDPAARGKNHGGHVMEVIGWGKSAEGVRYWKVYNSWLNWGERGYGEIAVGELSIGDNVEAPVMTGELMHSDTSYDNL